MNYMSTNEKVISVILSILALAAVLGMQYIKTL
jgi:hypothetical protein